MSTISTENTTSYPTTTSSPTSSSTSSSTLSSPLFNLTSNNLAHLLATGSNPKLFVFDLDFTIWPYDCDKDVIAPFTPSLFGGLIDKYGRPANTFSDVKSIIETLVDANIQIAYASRNRSVGPIEQLLRATTILTKTKPHINNLWSVLPNRNFFHAYSSNGNGKTLHFTNIKSLCGVEFNDMLFFDDLFENIAHARALGTTSVHLGHRGLTFEAITLGILRWRDSMSTSTSPTTFSFPSTIPTITTTNTTTSAYTMNITTSPTTFSPVSYDLGKM